MYIRQGIIFSSEDTLKMQTKSRLEITISTLDWGPVINGLMEAGTSRLGPNGYPYDALLNALVAMRL